MLSEWNSFYVMIGSSAAALTGLMFVVITLVSDDKRRASHDGVATFTTPTVVHFSCALFIAALMSAPFHSLVPVAIVLGLVGLGCGAYVGRVAIKTAQLELYRPDLEDWTFNVALPMLAYVLLIGGAIAMQLTPTTALYAPAAAVALIIFVGIHNAWDVVTFLAMGKDLELERPTSGTNATSATSE
jgi:hypothetical protein